MYNRCLRQHIFTVIFWCCDVQQCKFWTDYIYLRFAQEIICSDGWGRACNFHCNFPAALTTEHYLLAWLVLFLCVEKERSCVLFFQFLGEVVKLEAVNKCNIGEELLLELGSYIFWLTPGYFLQQSIRKHAYRPNWSFDVQERFPFGRKGQLPFQQVVLWKARVLQWNINDKGWIL